MHFMVKIDSLEFKIKFLIVFFKMNYKYLKSSCKYFISDFKKNRKKKDSFYFYRNLHISKNNKYL